MSTSSQNTTSQSSLQELLRSLPQVEKLLKDPEADRLLQSHPRQEVVLAIRETLNALRAEIQGLDKGRSGEELSALVLSELLEKIQSEQVLAAAQSVLETRTLPSYQRVINGTGIVLHTGLGRAAFSSETVEALSEGLGGYTLVEVDQETGARNRREGFLAELLCEMTGAEAATVVNNNAAATLIILAALARGREVVISRGQLVEIGGSYRIPVVMEESGARLVEVGTTNRTYIEDYRNAVGPETGLLLKVHTSNYEIAGFAHHTPLEDLVALGREKGIPVVSDLGSGCLVDLSPYGFLKEPLVSDSLRAGADLVCFSGDKLLGGPQAGIILGRKDLVDRIRSHPLFRAVRIGKMTLIAMEATLRHYRDPEQVVNTVPALAMLSQPEKEIRKRADRFRRAFSRKFKNMEGVSIELVQEASQTGSGSLPTQELRTWAVAIKADHHAPDLLGRDLRLFTPPIFTRIRNDRILIDFRTLLPGEEKILQEALGQILQAPSSHS